MNYLNNYKQTGDLSSRPQITHVQQAWDDPFSIDQFPWAEKARQEGHGEYVDNVFNFIRAMKHRGLTENDIPTILAIIEPSE